MNLMQKLGVFGGALLTATVVWLHAPWEGYDTKIAPSVWAGVLLEGRDLPLLQWSSNGARVTWLLFMRDFLAALTLIAALSCFWIWLFHTKRKEARKTASELGHDS